MIGIHFVKGEKNQTRTLMDVVVFQRLVAHVALQRRRRERRQGTRRAHRAEGRNAQIERGRIRPRRRRPDRQPEDIVFAEFSKQAATGTVRGPGTPAIRIATGAAVAASPGGGHSGGGAFGLLELAVVGLVAAACRDLCR